jgi:hypothetical protein
MNIKNVVIGIAILILTISVVVYGVSVFYDSPKYEDYCSNFRSIGSPLKPEEICPTVCVAMYQMFPYSGECEYVECGSGCGANNVTTFTSLEGCEAALKNSCDFQYNSARETYSRNIFLIALPLGILLIIVGAVVFGLEVVGAGLAGGGVGVLLWGVFSYWEYGSDLLRFGLSLIGLLAVIWSAYRFNKKK